MLLIGIGSDYLVTRVWTMSAVVALELYLLLASACLGELFGRALHKTK
ncbi:hypothetical protein [Sporomusa carbonis]